MVKPEPKPGRVNKKLCVINLERGWQYSRIDANIA